MSDECLGMHGVVAPMRGYRQQSRGGWSSDLLGDEKPPGSGREAGYSGLEGRLIPMRRVIEAR